VITGHVWPFDTVDAKQGEQVIGYPDNMANFVPGKGPSTYLHAGAGVGWPHDHKAEDTFELPQKPAAPQDREYTAEFRGDGSAVLVLYTSKVIANFDTMADARKAAEALNNHEGY
jgi:hypothetical protein